MSTQIPSGKELVNYFEQMIKNNIPPAIGIDVKFPQLVNPISEALYSEVVEINYNHREDDGPLNEIVVFPAGDGDLKDKLRTARRDGVGILVVYPSYNLSDGSIADMEVLTLPEW